jgi:hypothetical protein
LTCGAAASANEAAGFTVEDAMSASANHELDIATEPLLCKLHYLAPLHDPSGNGRKPERGAFLQSCAPVIAIRSQPTRGGCQGISTLHLD